MIGGFLHGIGAEVRDGVMQALKASALSLLNWIWKGILSGGYWICLFICIASLIAYIAGFKKTGKYVGISIILYFILQSLNAFFN